MAIESNFLAQTENGKLYFPPTYEQDGFIHATGDPSLLLEVGNHFYKTSVGEWTCLKLDPSSFGDSVVKYEAPAPVGNTESFDYKEDAIKFPHIYGGIGLSSVISFHKIIRAEDGTFLSIHGIECINKKVDI